MSLSNRFVSLFPTVGDLAEAPSQTVMKTWEGLGYYSRARNLHSTAQVIHTELGGIFPSTYAELVKLKGVGPYTAAAIASMAFGEATPVIDGNVFRFVSRYFGVEADIADQKNRKFFMEILEDLIPQSDPGTFNQAMMEYGATVCKPSPDCASCLFRLSCYAHKHQKQQVLPVKTKKVKSKEVFFSYLIFEHEGTTLMRQRTESIWTGLFEFHNITHEQGLQEEQITHFLSQYPHLILHQKFEPVQHILTHRKLWVTFYHIEVTMKDTFRMLSKDLGLNLYSWEEVLTLPRPKVIVNHLQQAVF